MAELISQPSEFALVVMKNLRIVLVLAVIAVAQGHAIRCYGDVVAGEPKAVPVATSDIPPPPQIAIPEPATFGVFTIGIALAAGLFVRNKRPA